jgi:AsmA protein
MRIARIVAIAVAALIVILVVGAIALLLFIDPNHYRGDIERAAQEHTGRRLTIQGKLELKIFPWLALAIHDVQLGNRAGFGSQPFLTVQNASIGVKLLPLLGNRLEVSRISISGVTVNLISRGAQNNWQDLNESKGPAVNRKAPVGGSAPASGSASIEGVDVTRTSVVLVDEVKKSTTELSNLELHSGRLSGDPDRAVLEDLVLQGTWTTTPSSEAPRPQGIAPEEAMPLPFSLRTSRIAFDAASQRLAPAKIEAKLGDSALIISVSGEKMTSGPVVTGNVSLPATSARKLLQSLGIAPPVTRDPRALSALALQTNFRLTPKQLQLTGLQLTLDDTRAQGVAAIEDLDTLALSFDLNINGINVDRYRTPVQKATSSPAKKTPPGFEPAKAPTPLPLETLRKLDVHGTLRVGRATFAAIVFTDVTMPLMAKDGHIRLGPTQARLYGGTYSGDIILDARPVQAQLSLNEHVRDTDIGALVKDAYGSARISGHADVNAAVAGTGNTDEAMTRSLSGKIDLNVKQGALNGIDVVYALQGANALLKREALPQRTGPERTIFNSLQATATLDKGVLRNEDLRIETDFLKVHGGGTLDLATGAIDYRLVTSVYKLPPSGGAGRDLDALKAADVPLIVSGTLASPTVRPDIEALAKGQLRQEVQQKAGDLVKKKLGDKLKDLFGH